MVIKVNIQQRTALTSSGAGTILTAQTADNPSGFDSWTAYAGAFLEYRVLASSVHFQPSNRYSKTTTLCVPGYIYVDRSNSGAPVSKTVASTVVGAKCVTLEDPWRLTWKMASVEDAQFSQVAAPVTRNQFIFAFDGLSASVTYGEFLIAFLVEYRMPGA